jgi:hypothetical protein
LNLFESNLFPSVYKTFSKKNQGSNFFQGSRVAKLKESGIRVGAIFSAKLAALVNDASGALAGLGEAELRKKLHERTQGILAEIREELEKV